MGNLVWLASYPKSGNTWVRTLLRNYFGQLAREDDVASPQPVFRENYASSRAWFEALVGLCSGELSAQEIRRLRPRAYRSASHQAKGPQFVKVHDAQQDDLLTGPLFPAEATRRAVYIVRNPLDLVVSWAYHTGRTIARSVDELCDPRHAIARRQGGLTLQLTQQLSAWATHVTSWADCPHFPVHIVRYEDLCADTGRELAALLRFLALAPVHGALVRRAVHDASFDVMKRREQAGGFGERLRRSRPFFRCGRTDQWQAVLSPSQVDRIVAGHGDIMRRFGYTSVHTRTDAPTPVG